MGVCSKGDESERTRDCISFSCSTYLGLEVCAGGSLNLHPSDQVYLGLLPFHQLHCS